ncbi:hypothetical protein C2S53_006966 [Perilla frutescens var. hirtella]|uniref:RING-type domain-containing protein n=1 Tax=Perilla frutescens var. hirtella TaxID=608512 RepID=A0AAD4IZS7_PERFH|nr:hypothetical protein C2S53_006966 [Perilla frutescens var. hirtella]
MICLYGETHLSSTFAVIFYTCICTPFLQITHTVVRFCKFLLDPHHQTESSYSGENPDWELNLPVSRFEGRDDEEMCSICLVELEGEDSVNKLPKCGHVFHAECMEKWIDRCQFTCPLCRSSVLRLRSSSCLSPPPPFCFDYS